MERMPEKGRNDQKKKHRYRMEVWNVMYEYMLLCLFVYNSK